jgi:hypothetical protein
MLDSRYEWTAEVILNSTCLVGLERQTWPAEVKNDHEVRQEVQDSRCLVELERPNWPAEVKDDHEKSGWQQTSDRTAKV